MLIIHPGLVTPTHIERCMQTAFNAKLNSGCLSRQVGAVITDKNFSIKAVGWNDVPSGQVPCNLRDIDDLCINKDYQTFSKYELEDEQFNDFIKNKYQNIKLKNNNLSGRTYQYCFKDMYNDLERKIKFIQELYMQKKTRFYKYQNMVDKVLKEEICLLLQVLVSYVLKKHIS